MTERLRSLPLSEKERQNSIIRTFDFYGVSPQAKNECIESIIDLRDRLYAHVYSFSSLDNTNIVRSSFLHVTNHEKKERVFQRMYASIEETVHQRLLAVGLSLKKMNKHTPMNILSRSLQGWKKDIDFLLRADDSDGVLRYMGESMYTYVLLLHALVMILSVELPNMKSFYTYRDTLYPTGNNTQELLVALLRSSPEESPKMEQVATLSRENTVNDVTVDLINLMYRVRYGLALRQGEVKSKSVVEAYHTERFVNLANSLSTEKVRSHMESQTIYDEMQFAQIQSNHKNTVQALKKKSQEELGILESFIEPIHFTDYTINLLEGLPVYGGVLRFALVHKQNKDQILQMELHEREPYLTLDVLPYLNTGPLMREYGQPEVYSVLAGLCVSYLREIIEVYEVLYPESESDRDSTKEVAGEKENKLLSGIPQHYHEKISVAIQKIEMGNLDGLDVRLLNHCRHTTKRKRVRVGKYRIIFEGTTVLKVTKRGAVGGDSKGY